MNWRALSGSFGAVVGGTFAVVVAADAVVVVVVVVGVGEMGLEWNTARRRRIMEALCRCDALLVGSGCPREYVALMCWCVVDGLGFVSLFIVVVVVGIGSPGWMDARRSSVGGALNDIGSPGVGFGGARKREALGVGAIDGFVDECRFLDGGKRLPSCSISGRTLLLDRSLGFARGCGSLRATFVEVRVGWVGSGNVNVGA